MQNESNLWEKLCSQENIKCAYKKARKRKTFKPYVVEFERNLEQNLLQLRLELLFHSYRPQSLKSFVIKDPKTRVISKSEFRDRIVHHALCNIIEPIFDKSFIFDSYANRKGKGTLKAIQRFDLFKRITSKNNSKRSFVLKADIKHYFENINRGILLNIIKDKIKDSKVLWLIKLILDNNHNDKGMPLGNLTSQFFANIYLNELDQYVKHNLKIKYYIRYVDDYVIFSSSKLYLDLLKEKINFFLKQNLELENHPDKSKVIPIKQGINFLGFRIFEHHKILKKSNLKRYKIKLNNYIEQFKEHYIDFDKIYNSFLGWQGYAQQANTYSLRKEISKKLEKYFSNEISSSQINSNV